MKSKAIFEYPKEIYNEWEVLDIYKKNFPEIVEEYRNVVKNSYCKPNKYKQIVGQKAKKFDLGFNEIVEKFKKTPHFLEDLIKISLELHKNYAFNFWIISYAMGEGPLAFNYVKLIEKNLKEVYPKDKERLVLAKEALIKTDFEIFYHKILMDSIRLADLLNKEEKVKKLLEKAKKQSSDKRKVIYDQIIILLKNDKKTDQWILHLFEWHGANKIPIYNLLNQGIDSYEKNIDIKRRHEETKRTIRQVFRDADKKLRPADKKELKDAYLMVKEMLKAKDFIYGRKDIKLFSFWRSLNDKIIDKLNKVKRSKIKKEERNFLAIPWSLDSNLVEIDAQKGIVKILK